VGIMAIEIGMKNVSACKRAGGRWNLKKRYVYLQA